MSRSKSKVSITPGDDAAIYCRISHVKDDDQTGVDRQERICREIAERLQLRIAPEHVYVDNNRSAWQRNRKRPGWDEMLKMMSEGAIRHVIVYHPDRLMRQPNYVASIRVHQGEEIGPGAWPAIIDRGQWDEVQQHRKHRAPRIENERKRPDRYYLLGGVATCTCGMRMAGTNGGRYAYYRCTRAALNGEQKCGRPVSAGPLERFMREVAVKGLTEIDVSGRPLVSTVRPEADVEAEEKDQKKLKELNQLRLGDDLSTSEYQSMRAVIVKRIKERQRRTVQRPVAVLEGIAGPDAEAEGSIQTASRSSRTRSPNDQPDRGQGGAPGGRHSSALCVWGSSPLLVQRRVSTSQGPAAPSVHRPESRKATGPDLSPHGSSSPKPLHRPRLPVSPWDERHRHAPNS